MGLIGYTLAIIFGLVGLIIAGVGASTLLSFDWKRSHSATTAELPELNSGSTGLVRIAANGFEFRARVAGLDNTGPGLMLLHGFPETSAMYTPLIEAAATAGYRVVAFDQRGYSPGARPTGVDNYEVRLLVEDAWAVANAVRNRAAPRAPDGWPACPLSVDSRSGLELCNAGNRPKSIL